MRELPKFVSSDLFLQAITTYPELRALTYQDKQNMLAGFTAISRGRELQNHSSTVHRTKY